MIAWLLAITIIYISEVILVWLKNYPDKVKNSGSDSDLDIVRRNISSVTSITIIVINSLMRKLVKLASRYAKYYSLTDANITFGN